MQLVNVGNMLPPVTVGYLKPIRDSPTKFDVVHAIFKRTVDIMKELKLGFTFLEVDQAIYNKILKVKFQLLMENYEMCNFVIVRMEGFHIMICVMRTIYSQFKGVCFVDLMSEVGINGYGTIENALRAGDVKTGVRYYNLLYEALIQLKIDYLYDEERLTSHWHISNDLRKCIEDVRQDPTSPLFNEVANHSELKLLPVLEGDSCMWLELFLKMVDILINLIHFQRTGNWSGFLELIYMFIPYSFSLNRQNYARDLS